MRILVLSDSHENIENMRIAVTRTQPELILHLGDLVRDAEELKTQFPAIPLMQVEGNCDSYDMHYAPLWQIYEAEGHRIFFTHGHHYRVKYDLLHLCYAAAEQNAELALFGHTHLPLCEKVGGLTLLNPGSIGGGKHPSYAVIEASEADLKTNILYI